MRRNLFLGILLSVSSIFAGATGKSILEVSEDYGLVDLATSMVLEVDEALKGDLGSADAGKLEAELAKRYTRETIVTEVIKALDRAGKPDHLTKLDAFFQSPLYKRILAGEKYTETPEGEKGMDGFIENLDEAKARKKMELVNGMIILTGVAGRTLDMIDVCHEAQYAIANSKVPGGGKFPKAKVEARLKADRKENAKAWQMGLTTQMLYAYKDLNEKELQAYYDQLQSQESKWFYGTIFEAIAKTIREKAKT